MVKKIEGRFLVGLDIGTSKIVAMVAQLGEDGELEVIGMGSSRCEGLKKGVVVNIEATVHAMERAIEEAELMAGCRIHSVYAGIAGSHIGSLNSNGGVAIRENEVSRGDIERVLDAARAVAIPADQKIIHALPQEYIIDHKQEGIKDPIGMSGVRLEAKVHVVTGAVSAVQNITKCVRRCGLEVDDIILEQLASGAAVLSDDERNLGVCLVDIGGGTTDIAVFKDGSIQHTSVVPIAGDQVTNDIAIILRTPTQSAEDIKVQYASALKELTSLDELIEVPSVGDRPSRNMSRQTLAEVIEPRYAELFGLIHDELQSHGFDQSLAAGMVLTGGSSKMEGVLELAEGIFHVPVRIGYPRHVSGMSGMLNNPIYSTCVGLLLFGKGRTLENEMHRRTAMNGIGGVLERMKQWFQGNF